MVADQGSKIFFVRQIELQESLPQEAQSVSGMAATLHTLEELQPGVADLARPAIAPTVQTIPSRIFLLVRAW